MKIFFVLTFMLSLSAMASTVQLGDGEVLTLTPNSTTTVSCSSNGNGHGSLPLTIVAKTCECYSLNGQSTIKMTMIYSDGTKKDVDVRPKSSWNCSEEAEALCNQR